MNDLSTYLAFGRTKLINCCVCVFFALLCAVNLIVLAIACWQAYEARDIQSEFAEAKYIAMTIFSLTQGFLTGLPTVAVARDNPETFFLTLTVLVFGVCMVVLSLIFIPKMLMQRRYGKLTISEQNKAMMVSVRLSARMKTEWGACSNSFTSRIKNNVLQNVQVAQPSSIDDLHNDSKSSHQSPTSDTPSSDELNGSPKNSDNDGTLVVKADGRRQVVSSYLDDDEGTADA